MSGGSPAGRFDWTAPPDHAACLARVRSVAATLVPAAGPPHVVAGGFSEDRKYVLASGDGRILVRVGRPARRDAARTASARMELLHAAGVRCPEPLALRDDADATFLVLRYVEGDQARDVIPALPPDQQEGFGLDAGAELHRLHVAIGPPSEAPEERDVRGPKFRRDVAIVERLGLAVPGQDAATRFAEEHLPRLTSRPVVFRHGDYHPGNLVARAGRLAAVIDFDRADFGDPVDDFYKTAFFGAPLSAPYARGLVRGYFGGEPPGDFWLLYTTHVAAVLASDIAWCSQHLPGDVAAARERVRGVLATHDFEAGGPPAWWA